MTDADRQRRAVILILMVFSAPLWLFLRSWYGIRMFAPLLGALLIAPWSMPLLDALMMGQSLPDHAPDYYQAGLLVPAFALQLIVCLIGAMGVRLLRIQPAHPGFAGRFLLLPGTTPTLPFELMPLAAACYALWFGASLPPLPVPDLLLTTNLLYPLNETLARLGLPASLDTTVTCHALADGLSIQPQPITPSAVLMLGSYLLVAIDCYFNDGLLRYFDWGARPVLPKQPPVVARLGKLPSQPDTGLGAIFSRRTDGLKRLAAPQSAGSPKP
jgi:hypothetical protein